MFIQNKRNKNGNISYIIVYVDDILVTSNREDTREIHAELSKECEIKNLGKVSQHLGIYTKKLDNGNLEIDQESKIDEVAENFNLTHKCLVLLFGNIPNLGSKIILE